MTEFSKFQFFFDAEQSSPDEGGVVSVPSVGPLGGGGLGAQPVPPRPLYHPDDINIQTLNGLNPHIIINPQVKNCCQSVLCSEAPLHICMRVHVYMHMCLHDDGCCPIELCILTTITQLH